MFAVGAGTLAMPLAFVVAVIVVVLPENAALAPDAGNWNVTVAPLTGALAAVIHDVQKGEVALMVEGHQVVVTDKQLVARIANAFANAKIG